MTPFITTVVSLSLCMVRLTILHRISGCIQCLELGCRVIELDCYDAATCTDGPVCKHGGTATKPVLFRVRGESGQTWAPPGVMWCGRRGNQTCVPLLVWCGHSVDLNQTCVPLLVLCGHSMDQTRVLLREQLVV